MQPWTPPTASELGGRPLEELVTAVATNARCKGRTKAGKRCRNKPADGSGRCRIHQKGAQVLSLVAGGKATGRATTEKPGRAATDDAHVPGPNEQALVRTLTAMGREEDADAARFQMLRSLAIAVDLQPTRAALWKEYREAINDLMKEAGDADDKLTKAVEALRAASEVGDTANG